MLMILMSTVCLFLSPKMKKSLDYFQLKRAMVRKIGPRIDHSPDQYPLAKKSSNLSILTAAHVGFGKLWCFDINKLRNEEADFKKMLSLTGMSPLLPHIPRVLKFADEIEFYSEINNFMKVQAYALSTTLMLMLHFCRYQR